ncbi:hypothetical protein ADIS_4618 [Lunatimonas lonarensis]|uniref:Uncharacterized protein n=1 Tax=Lunatimonas lonarensis TaxID=1232681 RepID=R7ZLK8_9BACT|nr:hypothetical protein ADIS_4618 [Lunatimonas lonarensis]
MEILVFFKIIRANVPEVKLQGTSNFLGIHGAKVGVSWVWVVLLFYYSF